MKINKKVILAALKLYDKALAKKISIEAKTKTTRKTSPKQKKLMDEYHDVAEVITSVSYDGVDIYVKSESSSKTSSKSLRGIEEAKESGRKIEARKKKYNG